MDFLGAFHPLVLHLPIGFLIAGFLVEVLATFRDIQNPQLIVRFLLGLGAVTALLSAVLGFLLSQTGGYSGSTFLIHQWSGVSVAVLSSAFYLAYARLTVQRWIWVGWSTNLVVLMVAGHFGGSLTHGEDFLLRDAPPFLQSILTSQKEEPYIDPDSAIIFTDIIQPIMAKKCASCHNASKSRGGLDLTTRDSWLRGGDSGPLWNEGDPSAHLLLARLYLPLDDKEHMPPKGNEQLIPSEMALIDWWIAGGMSMEAKASDVKKSPLVGQILGKSLKAIDPYDQLVVAPVGEQTLQQIAKTGIIILPISQNSPLLEARLAGAHPVTADQWQSLLRAAEQIVHLDLPSSALTNEQVGEIGRFKNLIQLSLKDTNVTDDDIPYLSSLSHLQHLNLYGTAITDESIDGLRQLPRLQHLYLAQTKVTDQALQDLQSDRPQLDLGTIP